MTTLRERGVRVTDLKHMRLAGLLRVCNQVRGLLDAFQAGAYESLGDKPRDEGRLSETLETIRRHVRHVQQLCLGVGLAPTDLPAPSRRAYQWLTFLSSEESLIAHLTALRTVSETLKAAAATTPGDPATPVPRIAATPVPRIGFFHTATLYRMYPALDGVLEVTASEAFITAPRPVIEALVNLALIMTGPSRRRKGDSGGRHRTVLRQYACGETFTCLLRTIEFGQRESWGMGPDESRVGSLAQLTFGPLWSPGDPKASLSRARGRHYDLEEVFRRVNADHFEGRLGRPVLAWNTVPARRKLGRYQFATDTVVLSRILDSPTVPTWVVDFIMYHELLHKSLGLRMTNGRQRAHTADFRQAEKAFPRYAEATTFIKRLSASAPRPPRPRPRPPAHKVVLSSRRIPGH
jgi:hypothetical protein